MTIPARDKSFEQLFRGQMHSTLRLPEIDLIRNHPHEDLAEILLEIHRYHVQRNLDRKHKHGHHGMLRSTILHKLQEVTQISIPYHTTLDKLFEYTYNFLIHDIIPVPEKNINIGRPKSPRTKEFEFDTEIQGQINFLVSYYRDKPTKKIYLDFVRLEQNIIDYMAECNLRCVGSITPDHGQLRTRMISCLKILLETLPREDQVKLRIYKEGWSSIRLSQIDYLSRGIISYLYNALPKPPGGIPITAKYLAEQEALKPEKTNP